MDFDQLDLNNIIYFPTNGKIPAVKKWQELTASKEIPKKSNYSILCGKASNITVIDIDLKADGLVSSGLEIWTGLLKKFNRGKDFETPIVQTGGGGLHVYFKYNPNIKTGTQMMSGYDRDGFRVKYSVDIRNDGGCCVGPGSTHPETKKKYKYLFEKEFDNFDPMEMPDFIFKALTQDILLGMRDEISFIPRIAKKAIATPEITESEEFIPEEFDQDIFREIIAGLDKNRAHSYSDWIKVCWVVGSIDRLYQWDNRDAVIEFSMKSPKFVDSDDVEKHYSEGNGRLGLGSLWFWLKEDDPARFKELYQKHKKQNEKKYYYADYSSVMDKKKEQGFLYKSQVEAYLRGALVKINNGGNTRFLSRNKDDDGSDFWELLHSIPFSDNKIEFPLPDEKGKNVKFSFHKVLQECCVYSDFPIYNKVDFRPYLREEQKDYPEGHIFNLFNGFPHNPDGDYDAECIKPILHCMLNVVCGGNKDFYDYYIRYIAHVIQFPNEKPGIAIIIISPEGLGKDLINHDFLKRVFGAKLLHRVNDLSAITRTFNKKLEGKLITVIGEVKSYCNETDSEKLKGIITDTTINIEPKCKDPYEINDFQRFITHTNNSVPVGIKPGDRRFVIHKITTEFIQSRNYYNELAQVVKDPPVAINFFKYLAQMDLSDFDIRVKPLTIAKKELQIATASSAFRFMADICTKRWILKGGYVKDDEIKIHTTKLYNSNYKIWHEENGEKNKLSMKVFKQRLDECEFVEREKKILIGGERQIGYKTTYTELTEKFKDYILQKNIDDEDDEEDDED